MDADGSVTKGFYRQVDHQQGMLYLHNFQSWKPLCVLIYVIIACLRRSNPWLYRKGANTVADLLYLTFQTLSPRLGVDGLATIEAPAKPARTFGEALSFLRSWRQQVLTVVNDLGGNPEPLKLLSTLRTLISSLVASDTAFAMEVSQIYRQTNVKTVCNDVTLLTTVDLLEVELSGRAQEDEEERRKQKGANTASASHAQKGGGKGKPKPICRDFMTENGCQKRRPMSLPASQHSGKVSQVRLY